MDWKMLIDELQETVMIVGALVLWGLFEFYLQDSTHATVTRTAIITIVTNIFTYKFTKSSPRGGNGGQ